MTTFHSSSKLQVVHLEPHILYCNWLGQHTEHSVIESGAVILTIQQTHRFSKVLNDNTRVTGSWYRAAQWSVEQWFPAMIHHHLSHFAWVLSPNIFVEIAARRAMPHGEVVSLFTNYHDAHNWLTNA